MKQIFTFLSKIINTIKFNWLYLLLSLVLPFTLYYIGQGKELMQVLHEKNQNLNIFLILTGFALMYYSIWVIPTYSIYVLDLVNVISSCFKNIPYSSISLDRAIQIFETTDGAYNGKSDDSNVIPIRHLATLPVISFHFVLAFGHVQSPSWQKIAAYLLWLAVYYFILKITENLYTQVYNKYSLKYTWFKKNPLWIGYGAIVLVSIAIASIWSHEFISQLLSHILLLIMLIANNSLHFHIEKITMYNNREMFRHGRLRYKVTVGVVFAMLFLFHYFNHHLHILHPVAISLFLLSFFIMLIDFFITTPTVMASFEFSKSQIKKSVFDVLSFLAVILLMGFTLFSWASDHNIRNNVEIPYSLQRSTLSTYYKDWKLKNNIKPNQEIVLICGQGGGSRAGAWTYANLMKIYDAPIFAISTVSGSSNGANNFITQKSIDLILNKRNLDSNFIYKLYNYNYLSHAFYGLLFKDGVLGFKLLQDRNYFHQEDEIDAFISAYNIDKRPEISDSIEKFCYQDLIAKYHDPRLQYKLPLHFINTAITQTGKRGVFSPVVMDTNQVFLTAKDVYDKFKKINPSKALLSHTAVDASQSFPFTSAYQYLENCGNLIDGGLYDNTGANTLLEIYMALKTIDPKQKFRILAIQSNDSDNKNTLETQSLIKSTIKSLSSSPFSGHAYYWNKALKQICDQNKDTLQSIDLSVLNKDKNEIALGIYLSNKTVERINNASKNW